jgi:two-component system, chemotaxis family, response regulator Rcp1
MIDEIKRILLVEDNPADARLMIEALKEVQVPHRLSIAQDGGQALAFLHREGEFAQASRPDLIFLNLNLPGKDGQEVLANIKSDPHLSVIPVIVLTSSQAQQDIVKCYSLYANSYVSKSVHWEEFLATIKTIGRFWLTVVKLPPS